MWTRLQATLIGSWHDWWECPFSSYSLTYALTAAGKEYKFPNEWHMPQGDRIYTEERICNFLERYLWVKPRGLFLHLLLWCTTIIISYHMTTSPRYFVERPPNVLDSPLGVYDMLLCISLQVSKTCDCKCQK
jgi:hypothetical protein